MAKAPPRNIRFDPDVLNALQEAATKEDRSVAWLVNRAVREWLAGKNYLPQQLVDNDGSSTSFLDKIEAATDEEYEAKLRAIIDDD